jgi:hypothetical protein
MEALHAATLGKRLIRQDTQNTVCNKTHKTCVSGHTALHCTALHCTALHCTALHCTSLHCTALHCTALPSATHLLSSLSCAEGFQQQRDPPEYTVQGTKEGLN